MEICVDDRFSLFEIKQSVCDVVGTYQQDKLG